MFDSTTTKAVAVLGPAVAGTSHEGAPTKKDSAAERNPTTIVAHGSSLKRFGSRPFLRSA